LRLEDREGGAGERGPRIPEGNDENEKRSARAAASRVRDLTQGAMIRKTTNQYWDS